MRQQQYEVYRHIHLRDMCFILVLFTMKKVFAAASPVSRQLQGISVDLAMASHMVSSCREKFTDMRRDENVHSVWQTIVQEAQAFAVEHEVDITIAERKRTKRKLDTEDADYVMHTGEERMRICMFIPVLDEICAQMNDRFRSEQTHLMREVSFFSSGNIRTGRRITPTDITCLTATYSLGGRGVQ